MSYAHACAAIEELLVLNAIEVPGAECAGTRARYRLANPDAGWICIDHGFVEGPRAPLKSLLSRDLSAAAGKPRITKQQAQKDILLTFIALHAAQDFGRFGGVDPKVIAGEFQRLSQEENVFQIPEVCVLEGQPLYCVVSAKEPLRQRFSATFANRILGSDCAGTSQASVEDRMAHAVSQLRKLKLIYTTHVIWDMNPIEYAKDAVPVATLFVKGTPLRRLERGLQYAVDAALKRTLTVPENEQFYPDGKGRWKSFAQDSGQHRYIVTAHLLLTACGVDADGVLGKKAERLDPISCRRSGVTDSVSWLRPRWQHLVNEALILKGSAERVDHRSFKARGITKHPTVHVGKRSATARGRTGLNARLRTQNAQALALEEQMGKLMRMKARLAARVKPTPDPQRAVPVVNVVDDRASDLQPWRRRKVAQLVPQRAVTGELSAHGGTNREAVVNTPSESLRKVRRRPGR